MAADVLPSVPMSASDIILITGASGRIGTRTAELLARGGHKLRLMSREPDRVPRLDNAEVVPGDFADPESLKNAFAGVKTALLISASGEPGQRARLHTNAFDAAAAADVDHLVYLSLQGAAPDSKYPFSRDHFLSEQHLALTGLPCTVLRNAYYLDMFLEKFDPEGVVRGPAGEGRGAFVSREDVARTAAAVLPHPPGGIHDVTGPEALSIAAVADRLSAVAGRPLRYQDESAETTRKRLSRHEATAWRVDLAVGWFEAIAAGELKHASDTVLRFTGTPPLTIEDYFRRFPHRLWPLHPAKIPA
jgi:uncharacterized protein YbjT (DUF2867 family)